MRGRVLRPYFLVGGTKCPISLLQRSRSSGPTAWIWWNSCAGREKSSSPSGRDKRLASDHSITVRGNEWYDHESKEGGGAISFVQTYYGLPYQEAGERLLDGEGIAYPQAEPPEPEERKEFALPPANRTMRRLYAYLLQQRLIDPGHPGTPSQSAG